MKDKLAFILCLCGKVENIFLFCGLIFGLAFLFVIPPFQVPDESAHFSRAYQISEGHLLSQKKGEDIGGYLPKSFSVFSRFDKLPFKIHAKTSFAEIKTSRRMPLEPEKKVFNRFQSFALNSPIAYLPQALGIWLGRTFGFGPLELLYMARIGALFFWLGLTYLAIRIIPTGKWALCTISFIPILVFLAPSASADSLTFGLTALTTALAVYLMQSKKELNNKAMVLIFVLGAIMSLIKLPYSLSFLVLPLTIFSRLKEKKRLFVFWGITLLVYFGLLGSWQIIIQKFYQPGRVDILVSPQMQLGFIKQHPFHFPHAMYNTYIGYEGMSNWIIESFNSLGWLDTKLPLWLFSLVIVNLTLGFLSIERVLNKLSAIYKAIFFLLPLGIFILINFFLFLSWTEIGGKVVDGIQGRYFLPVIMLFVPSFAARKSFSLDIKGTRAMIYMTILQIIILGTTLFYLYSRYYLPSL